MTEIVFSYSRPSLAELGSRQSSIIEETRQNASDTCKAGLHIDGTPFIAIRKHSPEGLVRLTRQDSGR